MSHSVYVAQEEGGPCKVGRSYSAQDRLTGLRIGSDVTLSMVYVGVCSEREAAKAIEAEAHRILRNSCCRGREWFSVLPETAIGAVTLAAKRLRHDLHQPAVIECRPPVPVKGMVLTTRVDEALGKAIHDLAAAENRNISNYLETLLRQHVADKATKAKGEKRK